MIYNRYKDIIPMINIIGYKYNKTKRKPLSS